MMSDHFEGGLPAIFCEGSTLVLLIFNERGFGCGKLLDHARDRRGADFEHCGERGCAGALSTFRELVNVLQIILNGNSERLCHHKFQSVRVVQRKNAMNAMLKPAPSVQSRTNCGRMRLTMSQAMVMVSGVTPAIQTGKDVVPDATRIENRMDAAMINNKTGAYVMIRTFLWRSIIAAMMGCDGSSTLFNAWIYSPMK